MMKISESIILAAGLGDRLRPISNVPKFAFKVHGLPLIAYPIGTMLSVGVRKFVIVVAKGYKELLDNILKRLHVEYVVVENPYPRRGNGYSFLMTKDHVKSKLFYVSMCDHIYPPKVPLILYKASLKTKADIIVGADSKHPYIDIMEATKILGDSENNVKSIGKELTEYNYVDIGVFIMSNNVYNVYDELIRLDNIRLVDVIAKAITLKLNVKLADIKGIPWTDIDTPDDLRELLEGERREVLETYLREVEFESLKRLL